MKNTIGLFLIAAFVGLSFSAEAQSGATRRTTEGRKNRPAAPAPSPELPKTAEPAAAPTADAASGEDDGEVVRVDTDLITVPVSVYDRDGRFVPNLTQTDFQVFDNDQPQEIAYFATTESPFTVALVLDMSYSTKFKIDQIQTAAYQFVMNLRPADKVLIVSFDETVRVLSEPTSDRETLRQAIKKTRIGGNTSLYEAVSLTFDRMRQIKGRKAIVLFTDGVDTSSRSTKMSTTLQQAREFDALVYPVYYDTYADVVNGTNNGTIVHPNPVPGTNIPQRAPTIPGTNIPLPTPQRRRTNDPNNRYPDPNDPRNRRNPNDPRYPNDPNDPNRNPNDPRYPSGGNTIPDPTAAEYERGKAYLKKLADSTAGRFYAADNYGGLGAAFDRICEELRRQYSLGYYPSARGAAGEERRVKVKVNRPKTAVRARDGYVVGGRKEELGNRLTGGND